MHADGRQPQLAQRGRHESVRVLARRRTEQQRVGGRHAVQAVARVQQLHQLLEALVVLHAHPEVAHELHGLVVAHELAIRYVLEGRHHRMSVRVVAASLDGLGE